MNDPVNHPSHYTAHPICEAIDICEHLSFNLGNAVKYLWRAGKKEDFAEDIKKAAFYLRREFQLKDGDVVFPREIKSLAKVLVRHPATDAIVRDILACSLDGVSVQAACAIAYAACGARINASLPAIGSFDKI